VLLLTMVPSFTVTARRLHDTNRTMLFAVLFPISAVAAPYGLVAGFIGIFAWHGTDGDTTVGIVLVISILCFVLERLFSFTV
jgi:Predicted membrane protein